MLEPDNRHLLMEALRPPAGMRLDTAVGTSFTLNLQAVLLAPVSFAVFGAQTGTEGSDPLALLEAVRRHASSITIFAQAGAITAPHSYQPTLAWLEESVVPVRPPKGHLFHPKVWALRFVNAEAAGQSESPPDNGAELHRLLVMSRNLTFDRSWDTIVVLDGTDTGVEQPESKKTADFIRSLANTAVVPISEKRKADIDDLADSISRIRWETPEGIDAVYLWPMGRGVEPKPDFTGNRSLVISPFISADGLAQLTATGTDHLLVSRPESMDGVGADGLTSFETTFVLDSDALPATGDEAIENEPETEPTASVVAAEGVGRAYEPIGTGLHGLHAKAYVVERGKNTHLFTGSTNATWAGLNGGVEFLVELVAKRRNLSIDSVLGVDTKAAGGEASLRNMLRPYRPSDPEPVESTDLERLTYRLESALQRLAEVAFTVELHAEEESDSYRLHFTAEGIPRIADGVTVSLRPSSLGTGASDPVTIAEGTLDTDGGTVSLQGITSFLVLTASAELDGTEVSAATLVNAELIGAPRDRMAKLLSAQLANKADVIRYLLFLLHDLTDSAEIDAVLEAAGGKGFFGGNGSGLDAQVPLFEAMLRCLASGGSALTHIGDLLDDLHSSPESRLKIPVGLEEIYWPIREAYDGTARPERVTEQSEPDALAEPAGTQ